MAIERHFTETFVARQAAREKQMQQSYRPVISVHKWFARRPGSLFRALALGELADRPTQSVYATGVDGSGVVCLDPFMGGGGPLIEAARLGMDVIGYDTNPMSRWIVERELADVDLDELAGTGELIARQVDKRLEAVYATTCESCQGRARTRYALWLREHRCSCGLTTPLLADTMLVSTGLGRHPEEVHLCGCCLQLSSWPKGQRAERCPHCEQRFDDNVVAANTLMVCDCGEVWQIPPHGTIETPSQQLVAVEYDCGHCGTRAYKTADADDHRRVRLAERRAARMNDRWRPDELIPAGDETARLLRWGYIRWSDLFGPRQLHALGLLADSIAKLPSGEVRNALATVFSDMLRYQNTLTRYDRQALKPTDVFAVHGFPVPRVGCEVHPVGRDRAGSGGFRHVLAKYLRAKRWCESPYETVAAPDGTRTRHQLPAERVMLDVGEGGRVSLTRGSLGAGQLPDASVDMVLTDPPYFANVQYAELMDFCYAWLRRLAADAPFFDVEHAKTDQDAVGSVGRVGLSDFAGRLSEVFVAAAAALKPSGVFAFTYHHNDLDAYAPLVVACLDAGLTITALYACPSEMRASTHIHGRNAATTDAVFVLRKPPLAVEPQEAFGRLDCGRFVAARVAALRRAGVKPTPSDRACLQYAAVAARAMARLADGWDSDAPVVERVSAAVVGLGGVPQAAVSAV
jgi:adenine-specific DNA methylase